MIRPESVLEPPPPKRAGADGVFHTTRWSIVLEAGAPEPSRRTAGALEQLCRDYWPVIYACVRRGGRRREEAEDLTQEFFASLLRYGSFSKVDPGKGRFRAFLRAALKHFLSNHWHREQARKRGGGRVIVSLDAVPGAPGEGLEDDAGITPELAFDRSWARTVVARATHRLQHEYESAGQGVRFEVLKSYLLAGTNPMPYADAARQLALGEAAVKSAIYKLRKRFGEMVRAEVAQTLSDPAEAEDELRHLVAVLSA